MKKLLQFAASLGLISLISAILLEVVLVCSFLFPRVSLLPLDVLRSIYSRELRNIIQVMPECARFDDYVSYTLRPGSCRFSNLEFETTYEINSAGLRDDELSLQSPTIVVVGDSFAMGWGVEQGETFAQLIEAKTGMRTLNAGVSSFGTAREIRLLERLDLAETKYLIVQYSDNDFHENSVLLEEGNLSITSEKNRQVIVERRAKRTEYFPFKYTITTLLYMWSYVRNQNMFSDADATDGILVEQETSALEAAAFVNALRSGRSDLEDVHVIVFEINGHNRNDGEFIGNVKSGYFQDDDVDNSRFASVVFLDVSQVLESDDYFLIDDHITARGHRVIADLLIDEIANE